jgi:ribosome maturation factor RimP
MDKGKIERLVGDHLEKTPQFLVSVTVSESNQINVLIDGDQGVTVADCISLSRHIESQLDRDQEDYALEVSSYGVGNPLLLPRQYIRNTGRLLEVHTRDGRQLLGRITKADESGIEIALQTEKKKGKTAPSPDPGNIHLGYEEISKSTIMIEF